MRNVTTYLQGGFAAHQFKFLQDAGTVASRMGTPLFLVGGSVRDLLLRRPLLDIDLVAEGDVSELVARLTHDLGGEARSPSQFGTFKLKLAFDTVDVATARTETYAQPGALPTVKPGTLANDLARRDFSINAMAIDLWPTTFGTLVDNHNGERDLRDGLIRVLHNASFQDDATRILRAIRYQVRLKFRLEPGMEQLLKRDLRSIDTISSDRLRREFDRCLAEPEPESLLESANELGVLKAMYAPLAWLHEHSKVLTTHRQHGEAIAPVVFYGLLAWALTAEQSEKFAQRLNLSRKTHKIVSQIPALRASLPALIAASLSPSGAYGLLRAFELEATQTALLACMDSPVAYERFGRFLNEWQNVRSQLSAQSLLSLGVHQGPLVGKLLEELLAYRLDNPGATVAQEEALVRRRMRELPSTS